MSECKRRDTGAIARLPDDLHDVVDQMLLAGTPYREVVAFLAEHQIPASQASVCRYAGHFPATVDELRAAQENMRVIIDEMDSQPLLDPAEAILRLASSKVFHALANVREEELEQVPVEKLLKESVALIRAAGYKKRADRQNKSALETALDANQSLLAEVLSRQYPQLYEQLMQVIRIERQKTEAQS